MRGKVLRIERLASRAGVVEEPWHTSREYQLADPRYGGTKHHVEHAVFVRTLEEAALLIKQGFSLGMGAEGKRPSPISPGSLRVVRAGDGNR